MISKSPSKPHQPSTGTSDHQLDRTTAVIRKLASLLAAGVPAIQARGHLEQDIAKFHPDVAERFELTWELANRLGGSPTPTLLRLAEVIEAQQSQVASIQLAYAAPRATAKLIMGLPFLALAIGQLIGLNPIGSITGSILGFLAFLVGIAFLIVGQMWVNNLLEKARPQFSDPGAFLDAVAIGLSAGLSPERAEVEARSIKGVGSPDPEAEASLEECRALSHQTGSSIGGLLLDAAQAIRAAHRNRQAQAISKLQIRLMLPLGLLTLPAFVLLAVAPMAIGMLTNT